MTRLPGIFIVFICLILALRCRTEKEDGCLVMVSALHKCYNNIGIVLPQSLFSILELPLDYFRICGTIEHVKFILCYERVMNLCENFQLINPLMFDLPSAKALTYGACSHKKAYLRGLECATNKSKLFHQYASTCFNVGHFHRGQESATSGNWTTFCTAMEKEVRCIKLVIKAFGCEKDFVEHAVRMLYSVQPSQCRDLSRDDYSWLITYGGLGEAPNYRMSGVLLITLLLASFIWCRN